VGRQCNVLQLPPQVPSAAWDLQWRRVSRKLVLNLLIATWCLQLTNGRCDERTGASPAAGCAGRPCALAPAAQGPSLSWQCVQGMAGRITSTERCLARPGGPPPPPPPPLPSPRLPFASTCSRRLAAPWVAGCRPATPIDRCRRWSAGLWSSGWHSCAGCGPACPRCSGCACS